jgi:polyisoprenoid-binding protein YceI
MNKKLATLTLLLGSALLFSFTSKVTSTAFKARTDKSSVKWKATKLTGSHEGLVTLKSGSFDVDMDNGLISAGEFIVDMTTIKATDTDSKKLYKHLHSADFFDTENHTTSTLVIKSSKSTGDKTQEITADLTIKGVTAPVTFTATQSAATENFLIYDGLITVDRTKYGITYKSSALGDATIDDNFTLDIRLVGEKK